MFEKSDSQISFVIDLLTDNYSSLFLGVQNSFFDFIFHADFINILFAYL